MFVDPDLLQYDTVWASAGTWTDVFGIEPHLLVEASEPLARAAASTRAVGSMVARMPERSIPAAPNMLRRGVWAAAGTWHDVFGFEPNRLMEASHGLVVEPKKGLPRSANR